MNVVVRYTLFLCFLSLLTACASAPRPVDRIVSLDVAQIKTIQSQENLLEFLTRLHSQLEGKSEQAYADDIALIPVIEDQLVALKKSQFEARLSASRNINGFVAMMTIEELEFSQQDLAIVSSKKLTSLSSLLAKEKQLTQGQVDKLTINYKSNTVISDKLESINALYALTGLKLWTEEKETFLSGLLIDVRAANASGEYGALTMEKIALLKSEKKGDDALDTELLEVSSNLFEKEFFEALGQGDTDKAYELLIEVANTADFNAIKLQLNDTTTKMAELFAAMASESVANPSNTSQSYKLYRQKAEINKVLAIPVAEKTKGEGQLLSQLKSLQAESVKKGQQSSALAYLYMIEEFDKKDYVTKRAIRTITDKIRSSAVKKVSTTSFESSDNANDFGGVMSSSVTKYLFEKVPHDVTVIEREQYEAIKREKSLHGESELLSAVDFLITGSVLEAKVEVTETKGRKMLRVAVGTETIPNPGYISWLELPRKDREKIDKPADTIVIDKKENIAVNVTKTRKVGIFSVSYRIVDAHSGRILFPDSLSMEDEYSDTSNEGVEMGDFVLPFKWAELPSDIKILDGLAKKIGVSIGERLVARLENQEGKYILAADKYVSESNCQSEIDSLGKALVIMERKGLDIKRIKKRLKESTLACQSLL